MKKEKIFEAKKFQTMKIVDSIENMPKNSLYQKKDDNEESIVTSLGNNVVEAISKAKKGDYIACGVNGEKWVIKEKSFKELYKIVDGIGIPSQIKYFQKINSKTQLDWENKYGDLKSIPANTDYYLMADSEKDLKDLNWEKINPIDVEIFKKTYKQIQKHMTQKGYNYR